MRSLRFVILAGGLFLATSLPLSAQQVTAADYARAERFLAPAVTPLVTAGAGRATWLSGDRFWYRKASGAKGEFLLVTPASKAAVPLFDHVALAAQLSVATKTTITAEALPFQTLELSADEKSVTVAAAGRRWVCDRAGKGCADGGVATGGGGAGGFGGRGGGGRGGAGGLAVTSPDSTKAVFIRDWNLWVRDVASGKEQALTTDGKPNYGYATDNAGWSTSDRAVVLWSPDSKKIATFQQDQRKVSDMYLVSVQVGAPQLRAWKYPLPGDSVVTMIERVIIDVPSATVTRLKMPPDQHRSTLGDNISMNDMKFSPTGAELAFASVSRDHKEVWVRLANTSTGDVKTVMHEASPTQFESRSGWRVWWGTREILWYSQREDWARLYLYSLDNGQLKRTATKCDCNVSAIVREDESTRTLWFTGLGGDPKGDPYFRHLYRVNVDKDPIVALTPEDFEHDAQLSPSGKYLISTHSTPDTPPVTVLRDATGKILQELGRSDISRLVATGWTPPMRITMKGRDGISDIYGVLFRPSTFDPAKKYPIINQIYPGPQTGSMGSRAFSPARGDAGALAELGFIVVQIDGMGTPNRKKSFMDAYYGMMGDNTLPDQVAGMKELAARFPWIDLTRVGIWGHSGGGFATAAAMFRYPDFFHVGIAESGNHDNRVYEDDWGERYQGLVTKHPNGSDSYTAEANQTLAKNLKGKLLLAHGTSDNNVPPNNTWLVVDELIKANKDFDLLMIPNAGHGYGAAGNYMMRRRWDYFVTNLLHATPPREYRIGAGAAGR
jgi:dipeptidyl aminopeptidase/acylaminoacyl peptidase